MPQAQEQKILSGGAVDGSYDCGSQLSRAWNPQTATAMPSPAYSPPSIQSGTLFRLVPQLLRHLSPVQPAFPGSGICFLFVTLIDRGWPESSLMCPRELASGQKPSWSSDFQIFQQIFQARPPGRDPESHTFSSRVIHRCCVY